MSGTPKERDDEGNRRYVPRDDRTAAGSTFGDLFEQYPSWQWNGNEWVENRP